MCESPSVFHLGQIVQFWWLVSLKLLELGLINTRHAASAASCANRYHGLLRMRTRYALVARLVVQRALKSLAGATLSLYLLIYDTMWLEI